MMKEPCHKQMRREIDHKLFIRWVRRDLRKEFENALSLMLLGRFCQIRGPAKVIWLESESSLLCFIDIWFLTVLKPLVKLDGSSSLESFHMKKACLNFRDLYRGRIECCLKRGNAGSSLSLKLIILIAFLVLLLNVSKEVGEAVPQLMRL